MGTIRDFELSDYIKKYNLEYFVETGTFKGDGVEYALRYDFKEINSIEIDKDLWEECRKKFLNNKQVKIWRGNSGKVMTFVAVELYKNTLFFLDAHFEGADLGKKEYSLGENPDESLPLIKELEVIKSRVGKYGDVVIIDDLRLFTDQFTTQSQSLDSHLLSLGKNIKRKDLVHFDLLEYLKNNFSSNFNIVVNPKSEGYLILTPKELKI